MVALNLPENAEQYYTEVLKLEQPVLEVKRTELPAARSRSHASRVDLTVQDEPEPIVLYEKTLSAAEIAKHHFPYASYHEAAVLTAITDQYPKLAEGRRYRVAPFVTHRINGTFHTIVTRDVPGVDLSNVVAEWRHFEINYYAKAQQARMTDQPDLLGKSYRAGIVKRAYIEAGVRGLADLVHDLRTNYKESIDIELALATRLHELPITLTIFNPLRPTEETKEEGYYEQRFVANLRTLLETSLSSEEIEVALQRLAKGRMWKLHPLNALRTCLRSATETDNLILSDCHPGQIKFINATVDLEDQVRQYVYHGRDVNQQDIKKTILVGSQVGFVDLGDLRLGHELMDYLDLVRNHSFGLFQDEVSDFLKIWTERATSLRGKPMEYARTLEKLQRDLSFVDIYRLVRAAVKSPGDDTKLHYVREIAYRLATTAKLKPIATAIRGPLAKTFTVLQQRSKKSRTSPKSD